MKRTGSIVAEVLSVIFVLGLIVAVVLPDRYDDPPSAERLIISRLETVRTALDRYWGDHAETFPTQEELDLLRGPTRSLRGHTGLASYLDGIPENPFTRGNRIGLITDPVGSSDWVYDPAQGVFKANDSEETRAL